MSLESYGSSRLFSLNDLTSQLLLPMADLQLHTMWDSPSGVDINNLFCLHVGLLIILLRSFYIDLLKHLCCVVTRIHVPVLINNHKLEIKVSFMLQLSVYRCKQRSSNTLSPFLCGIFDGSYQ
jgi:hypothetical protein